MWIPWEDDDPVVRHYPGRKSVGYFGAVRLRDGLGLFRKEAGMFDGITFWKFLQPLRSLSGQSGRRVIVITDNAKYHHAKLHQEWREQQAPGFSLDYLPPYSPELNPNEMANADLKQAVTKLAPARTKRKPRDRKSVV